MRNRFFDEASLMARLNHSSIARVIDAGCGQGNAFVVTEWFGARTLETELSEEGKLPLDRVAALMEQICGALEYAHSRGVIHRNVKPSNIVLDQNGSVYITDFGIAAGINTLQGESTRLTRETLGTAEYMSPEQITGYKRIDHRADIYSVGVMAYEMLTSHTPFERDTEFAVKAAQVNEPPPSLRLLCQVIPQPVEDVVLKALAKNPDDRYQNATDLSRDFRRAASMGLSANLSSLAISDSSGDQLPAFTRVDRLKLLLVRFARWAGWLSSLDQDVLDEYINFQERKAAQSVAS